MKKKASLREKALDAIGERAEKALVRGASRAMLGKLPVDQRKLRVAAALMEPKNLRRLAVVAVGGSAALSLAGQLAQARITRRLVARELKRQLAPLNKKLDALEKENRALRAELEKARKQ